MPKPWEISVDVLEQWAERVEAASVLPLLVRRLLAATLPLRALDMGPPSDRWDGRVLAAEPRSLCPEGPSLWATSVADNVQSALDDDFEHRTDAAPPSRGRATYIAVTARPFPGKAAWADQKRTRSSWADVRAYDAEDLTAWLARAPAVARWFAAELRLPASAAADVESYLAAWSARAVPPIPPSLALAGREPAAREIRAWLATPRPSALHVRADSTEEALVFAAAALSGAPPIERERWLSRALVVDTPEAFRSAARPQDGDPLILLPRFDDLDPAHEHACAYVLVPRAEGVGGAAAHIALAPIPLDRIAAELIRAGVADREAHLRAGASGGRLARLASLSARAALPGWAEKSPWEPLAAMLLVGAWDPTNQADGDVLRRLGAEPDEVEALCNALCGQPDAPIRHEVTRWGRGAWRCVSPANAWRALARGLDGAELDRFAAVAADVLGEVDPRTEVPWAERVYVPAHPRARRSAALREGIAESIVRLALADPELGLGPSPEPSPGAPDGAGALRGSERAAAIVRRLLPPEHRAWASLSDLLPVLAEAAPAAFLDALDRSLDRGDAGVAALFAEDEDFTSPHTGLLWAMETLGWDPALMPRVAEALARLAEGDHGGELTNRPAGSLSDLLHPSTPQTAAPVEARLAAIEGLLERHPAVGWRVALGMLRRLQMDMMAGARRPKYLPWRLPPEGTAVPAAEAELSIARIARLLVRYARGDAERWAELLDRARHLPEAFEIEILDGLAAARPGLVDPEGKAWAALRAQLDLEHRADRAGRSPAAIERLEALHRALAPKDPVTRAAWLFSARPPVPERVEGGWKEIAARVDLRRDEALADLWREPDRWALLAALAAAAPAPAELGAALARAELAGELEQRLLDGPADPALAPLFPAFVAARLHVLRAEGLPWLTALLRGLAARGRPDAVEIAVGLYPAPELWDVIDAIGDPLRAEYWRRVQLVHTGEVEDWERAIANLLDAGREAAALEAASASEGKVSSATVLRVLERLRDASPVSEEMRRAARKGMASYHVERLLEALDRDPTLPPERIAQLELSFLALLSDGERGARHLLATLGDRPDLFVALVGMVYRRHGEEAPLDLSSREELRTRAQRAHEILDAWTGYPGAGLPEEEREARLLRWANEALDRARAEGGGAAFANEVAKVLARAPAASDGLWPCRAARELIEAGGRERLADRLQTAKWNLRGMTSRPSGEGGEQERRLAAAFHAASAALRGRWPRTAEMLQALARTYDQEAIAWDAEARCEIILPGDLEAISERSPQSHGRRRGNNGYRR